jgi:hypothetical protein
VGALLLLLASPAVAQQAHVGSPFVGSGHSFYERIGISWGLQGNGWFFQWPGGMGGGPAFGGFDPGAQAQFGSAFRGNGVSGFFQVTAGQGSDTFLGGSSSSVTVPHGGFGLVSDVLQRPFVVGLVPIVGAAPVSPLEERLARIAASGGLMPLGQEDATAANRPRQGQASGAAPSTAESGDVSVAEIDAQQRAEEAAKLAELEKILEKAESNLAAGKLGLARMYYQQALRRAGEGQRPALEAKIKAIDQKRAAERK